ncbi:hypothetical protein VTI74DRAFT_10736 [Chaetomium olivicolor]
MAACPAAPAMVAQSTLSGIKDLPVELIRHICSYLSPGCFKKTTTCIHWNDGQTQLSRLSKTCRRLRDIVQPMVFHCFTDWGRTSLPRMIRLVRTLKERPDLGQHIKSIAHTEPFAGDLDPENKKFIEDAIVDLGIPAVPKWWNVDGEGQYRLLPFEVLLTLTPNLETLDLPLDCDWDMHVIPQLVKTRPPFLTKLTDIKVSHFFIAGDRWDVSFDAVAALLAAAPNVYTLCLPSPSSGAVGGSVLPLANLHRLLFQVNCFISPELLTDMLDSAPQLEMVALHWDALADAYDSCEDRRTTDAWNALERRRDTLGEIRLDIRNDTEHGVTERSSMADFEKLEVLAVDGHALHSLRQAWRRKNGQARVDAFFSQFFPPSIREVTIWNPDAAELKGAMLRFAKVAGVGRYPNLKSVVLAPSERSDRFEDSVWENPGAWDEVKPDLEHEFGKRGIKFEIRKDSPYWMGT